MVLGAATGRWRHSLSDNQSAVLEDGDWIVVSDRRGRENLFQLRAGGKLHVTGGSVECDDLIGCEDGTRVRTKKGDVLLVFRAILADYTTLMPRGAQIITPKDAAMIVQWADIYPGASVVEAGIGSGALTLSLLRAVGEDGRVLAFELREEFANCARKNVLGFSPKLAERLELRLGDVHDELRKLSAVDRIVLDLQDPWLALPGASAALRAGGILLAYLPTIRQVDNFVNAILDTAEFGQPEVIETILRPWIADRVRLRPESRITGHTAFLVRARRMGAPPSRRMRESTLGSSVVVGDVEGEAVGLVETPETADF